MKHFKLKDPGSAITHFIGMLMAMFAATPLILRAMRAPGYRSCHFFKYFYCEHDSAVCGKHNLSHF